MKIPNFKRLNRNEFRDFPPSVERLIGPLNDQLSSLTSALQNGITTDNNVAADSRLIPVKHAVENEVELQRDIRPTDGRIAFADNYPDPPPVLQWRMAGVKKVRFTCYFFDSTGAANPAGTANVRLVFKV
jgi:hypothetical protein